MSKEYEILERAKDNVASYMNNTRSYREVALDDTEFLGGNQWTTQAKKKRGKRPQSVINDAPTYKRKVQDMYKRRQSSIKVSPIDNNDDPKKARVFQGIVNRIMRKSLGNKVMDSAWSDMLTCGMGYCYVDSEYESARSNNQILTVEYINDPFKVFIDLNHKKLDRRDMDFGGFLFDVSSKEFERLYGDDIAKDSFPSDESSIDKFDGQITLCRYYERDYKQDTLVSFINPLDGKIVSIPKSEMNKPMYKEILKAYDTVDLYSYLEENSKIITTRTTEIPVITCYIMNNSEILSETVWPGKYIPIIPTLGERYVSEGSVFWTSLIRWMKEPARLYNYHSSNMIEWLAMKAISPIKATPEQLKGHERAWATANQDPKPWLYFNPIKDQNGNIIVTPPTDTQPAEIPQGWHTASQQSHMDKKNTLGLQDVAMGIDGQENTGKAIIARSDLSLDNVSVFIDARTEATNYLGMVLVDLIPHYFDSKRVVQIINEDGSESFETINDKTSVDNIDIANSEYDVYVDVGPSYESQRKESQSTFIEIAKLIPNFVPAFADKIVEYMDIKDSNEVVKRIKKIMPQDVFLNEDEEITPEQMNAQINMLSQQLQDAQTENNQLTQMLMSETQRNESDERIAKLKSDTDLQKEMIRNQGGIQQENIKQQALNQREVISSTTDLQQTKMTTQADINIQMMKMMEVLGAKIDAIKINNIQEI